MIPRRQFLSITAATLAGGALAACNANPKGARGLLAFAGRQTEKVETALFRHRAEDRVPMDAIVSGMKFPQYFISRSVPIWDPAVRGEWRLEVTGAVRRPLSLTLSELMGLPAVRQKVDHFCVEGWNARAEWWGVRVSELARLAQLTSDAQVVDFQSFDDGYHESWDIDSALHRQTIIAYAKDGAMLPPGWGAPARVHSPVKLGYKNTKYLTRIVFQPQRNGGYWSDRGYEWYGGT